MRIHNGIAHWLSLAPLDKLEFETTWAGVFCMTRNWASIFGRIERGVFASLGYAGIGVPRNLFRKILSLIDDLRPRPAPA